MSRTLHLDDLPRLPIVAAPVLSPEGSRYACTVQTWDLEEDRYRKRIWSGPVSGKEAPRPLTDEKRGGFGPAFSPDGRYLVFLSDRKEEDTGKRKGPRTVDLWALDLSGGEAVRLTRLPGSCSQLEWSPDGERILFIFQPNDPELPARAERIAHVLREAGESLPESYASSDNAKKEEPDGKREPIAHHITRLHWREDGRGILPKHRMQLWTLDVSSLAQTPLWQWAEASVGDTRLRRLTAGPYDVLDPAFAPDGERIAFISNRSADPDRLSGDFDVWVVPAKSGAVTSESAADDWDAKSGGIAAPTRLPAPRGPKFTLAWSPDASRIAYLAHDEPLDLWGCNNVHVWSVSTSGKEEAIDLMPDFDRSASLLVLSDVAEVNPFRAPIWIDSGRKILFLATDGPRIGIYEIPSTGGEPRRVHEGDGSQTDLTASADGTRLVFLTIGFATPPDVWTASANETPRRLTTFGADWAASVKLSTPQLIPVPCAEGHTVDAFLLRPPDFDASVPHPMILQIHGGPYAAYGDSFLFEFHWLASQGYCVLFANPRGSQGYGYEFAEAIRQNLADPAHRDLMAAVDLVAERSYIDAERLGVTGGSWGGFMTNWIVTQTERFRAAAAQRSICDFEADFGVSDYGYEVEFMFGGPPWTHREVYERCSPLTYVENVRTPLLLVHSEEDWRCPPAQAESFYGALKMLGREVEMVRFPNESHGLSRGGTPSRRLERLRVLGDWFARYLRPAKPHQEAISEKSREPVQPAPEGAPVR